MRKLNLINTANPPPSASMGSSSSSSPSMPEVRLSDQALSLCSPPLTVTSSSHLQSLYGHCPPGKNFPNHLPQPFRYLFRNCCIPTAGADLGIQGGCWLAIHRGMSILSTDVFQNKIILFIGFYCYIVRPEDSFQTLTLDATSRTRTPLSTSLRHFQTVTTNGNKRVSRFPCLWMFEMRDKIK